MNVYPIFLNNLTGRRCVVFWGGYEGERKILELLDHDADVVLISPDATETLHQLAADGRLTWHQRTYRPGDLTGAFLTIVSETDPGATAPIWEEAQAENILINAMDDVPHCTFVAGSVVRRGQLVISISSSGAAPAFSVRFRQKLEHELGPAHERFLAWMRVLRKPMATHYPDFETRRTLWYTIVDDEVLDLLIADRPEAAYRRLAELVGAEVAEAVLAIEPALHLTESSAEIAEDGTCDA